MVFRKFVACIGLSKGIRYGATANSHLGNTPVVKKLGALIRTSGYPEVYCRTGKRQRTTQRILVKHCTHKRKIVELWNNIAHDKTGSNNICLSYGQSLVGNIRHSHRRNGRKSIINIIPDVLNIVTKIINQILQRFASPAPKGTWIKQVITVICLKRSEVFVDGHIA